jgi:DNA transformation protein and related proteins
MDFADIKEMFSCFGAVDVRRMFGGMGIYADGTMFALVADGVIYLKSDEGNAASFDREDLGPFTYTTQNGERGVMSYRRMPDRLYDDPDELAVWSREALAAARRGKKDKAPSRKAPSKKAHSKRVPSNRAPSKKVPSKSVPSNKAPPKKSFVKKSQALTRTGTGRRRNAGK